MIVFASILGAILATGLLALTPSPMIKNAGVQMYEDQYNYHDNNNNYYQQDDYQHGYNDDNSYYKEDNQYGYDDSNYRDYNEYSYDDNSRVQLNFADKYSAYPSNDHKFACKTGQFEGFFVKSSEFCDLEIPPGPEGPQGEQGEPGINGQNGAQGPQGPAGINVINASNPMRYLVKEEQFLQMPNRLLVLQIVMWGIL